MKDIMFIDLTEYDSMSIEQITLDIEIIIMEVCK